MNWNELIGKKIVAFRGYRTIYDSIALYYILFDDGESFLYLKEQDKYDYHDCDSSARILNLHKDAKRWQQLFDKENVEECDPSCDPFS